MRTQALRYAEALSQSMVDQQRSPGASELRTEASKVEEDAGGEPATRFYPGLCCSAPVHIGLETALARALAQSGDFYGLPPLEFELSFEEGFQEAREWLEQPADERRTRTACQVSRAKGKAA